MFQAATLLLVVQSTNPLSTMSHILLDTDFECIHQLIFTAGLIPRLLLGGELTH